MLEVVRGLRSSQPVALASGNSDGGDSGGGDSPDDEEAVVRASIAAAVSPPSTPDVASVPTGTAADMA